MDYGQTGQAEQPQAFFTAGAGTNDVNVNTFGAENNLDLSNEAASWASPVETTRQGIGAGALGVTNAQMAQTANATPEVGAMPPMEIPGMPMPGQETGPRGVGVELDPNLVPGVKTETDMGQITEISAPAADAPSPSEVAAVAVGFNKEKLKTTDTLNEEGVKEVDAAMQKLNQDGNIADFYNLVRGEMLDANMKNSYGENAAWKGEAA